MSELETHPCFTAKCSDYARIHLPVAPKCNMQCNYCLRKYSCVNESRPGVVARVMVPEDAVEWYLQMKAKVPKLTVAGIAGPGDALANWPAVSRTLSMIREVDKDVFFCLSTNGLYLPKYAKEIAALGVDYVTVTVNAITSNTGAHIYSFINDDGKKYVGEEALLGAKLQNILPMLPVEETAFAHLAEPAAEEIAQLRQVCRQWMPQMQHCNRCRADAVGALTNPCILEES